MSSEGRHDDAIHEPVLMVKLTWSQMHEVLVKYSCQHALDGLVQDAANAGCTHLLPTNREAKVTIRRKLYLRLARLWSSSGSKEWKTTDVPDASLWDKTSDIHTKFYLDAGAAKMAEVRSAIEEGAVDVNVTLGKSLETPLMSAAMGELKFRDTQPEKVAILYDIIKLLVHSGANLESADKEGDTALVKCSALGCDKAVKALIDCGANVNTQGHDNRTPLMSASRNGHFNTVKLLISAGADPSIADAQGMKAADHANERGFSEIGTLCTPDPRWDVQGFEKWATTCQAAWVRVGYLRELRTNGIPIPYRQNAPRGSLCIGSPPPDVQLYAVSPYTHLGEKGQSVADKSGRRNSVLRERQPDSNELVHPDPDCFLLGHMVDYLNQDNAYDDDLVLMHHISAMCFQPNRGDKALFDAFQEGSVFISTYHRIKCLPILEVPKTYTGQPVIKRLWGLHEFFLSAYCQRIINSTADLVKVHLTPDKLRSAHKQIETAPAHKQKDRDILQRIRANTLGTMKPASSDKIGFHTVCEHAQFRWIRVSYIHELAKKGGPAPRCQDIPYGNYVDGVPDGRHYVVSHSWNASNHFDPSGRKMKDLSEVLKRLDAADDAVVFIDYMSLTQPERWLPLAYVEFNPSAKRHVLRQKDDMVRMKGRTSVDEIRFSFALFETTRLYAFRSDAGPSVIIIPTMEAPDHFPNAGPISLEENTVCTPPRKELKSAWGFSKSMPYEESGWPCAEFTVSRMNKTIINGNDPAVTQLQAARKWPEDVEAYAAMMDEHAAKPVVFTKKGDREMVRFNFFKFSYPITQ